MRRSAKAYAVSTNFRGVQNLKAMAIPYSDESIHQYVPETAARAAGGTALEEIEDWQLARAASHSSSGEVRETRRWSG